MMSAAVIVIIVIAICFISFFAGIEVAFANANRLNIELKKKQGFNSGLLLSRFIEEPSQFIGTVLVGYNIFLTTFVLMVSAFWIWAFDKWNLDKTALAPFRIIVEILLSALVVILLGEFIPKAVFKARSDFWLMAATRSGLLGLCHQLFYPVSRVLVNISKWLLKYLFNIRLDEKKEPFSRADLENFFQQTQEYSNENQDLNTELFEAALSLPTVKVRECLVPRKEIEGIDIHLSIEEARQKFVATKLSKMVVYEGNIDHVLGYIHQLDLFKRPAVIQEILLPIPAIPESMSATDLISKFSRERKSIAWVVDEFGGTAGIVTMEDVLEEIFGEIRDEYDVEEFEEKKISEEEFILSGRLELDYLNEKYGLEFPENESETLSGYIIHQHETIPRLKERIIIGNYEFEVMNVSDTRIEMVKVKVLK